MDSQIVAIYCICDDISKGLSHRRKYGKVACFLKEQGYIPNILEKSHFNRRQHRIEEFLQDICTDYPSRFFASA